MRVELSRAGKDETEPERLPRRESGAAQGSDLTRDEGAVDRIWAQPNVDLVVARRVVAFAPRGAHDGTIEVGVGPRRLRVDRAREVRLGFRCAAGVIGPQALLKKGIG